MKFKPAIDKNFRPLSLELAAFRRRAKGGTLTIVIEDADGYNFTYRLPVTGDVKEDYPIAERIVKSLLWIVGGNRVYVAGNGEIYRRLKADYSAAGTRAFDAAFMERVYEKPFEVVDGDAFGLPAENRRSVAVGNALNGCRIGFDAGGSDRKVSAVMDGEVLYSEEVEWLPKISEDWRYQYDGILTAMKTAASKLPRVDAIGVSSAGIYRNNKIMVASLFNKIPREDFDRHVKNMYLDIAAEIGAPVVVANDGDVTALAGSLDSETGELLGIAMGTSEAAGYVDGEKNLNGWLSELAFVPVDCNPGAMEDEWSGDIGCGVKYFSQDGVIKLAEMAGYRFEADLTPAQKLKVVQKMMADGGPLAGQIYHDIGVYLGYALPYYSEFYAIKEVLLLGRVTSGKGGEYALSVARERLKEEFGSDIVLKMPDEKQRRLGQSIAAAMRPEVK